MLVRFITQTIDRRSGRRQGLFAAARELRESGRLSACDEARLNLIKDWFSINLPVPDRFSLSARAHAKEQAISWFKDSAQDCISRMRDYASVLDDYDVLTEMIRTSRPGVVVYEDEHQIVAYPFADTPT